MAPQKSDILDSFLPRIIVAWPILFARVGQYVPEEVLFDIIIRALVIAYYGMQNTENKSFEEF